MLLPERSEFWPRLPGRSSGLGFRVRVFGGGIRCGGLRGGVFLGGRRGIRRLLRRDKTRGDVLLGGRWLRP